MRELLCVNDLDNTAFCVNGAGKLRPIAMSITDGTTTEIVNPGDTVTFAAGNGLNVAVSATDTVTYTACLSGDAGNDLAFGTDGCLFFNETPTSLTQNTATGVITYINEDGTNQTANVVSGDANNNITVGTDGGAFLDVPPLLTGGVWNDATNTLELTLNTDGTNSVVNIPFADVASTFLSDFTVAGNTGTDLINNHETLNIVGAANSGVTTTVTGNTVTIDFDCTEALDLTGFATC